MMDVVMDAIKEVELENGRRSCSEEQTDGLSMGKRRKAFLKLKEKYILVLGTPQDFQGIPGN